MNARPILAREQAIFFKKERFDLLDKGVFWLSETPSVPGTTFYGNGGDTNNVADGYLGKAL